MRLLIGMAGEDKRGSFSVSRGDVTDRFDDTTAKRFVEVGKAEAVDEPEPDPVDEPENEPEAKPKAKAKAKASS